MRRFTVCLAFAFADLSAEDDTLCICSYARVLGNHCLELSYRGGGLNGVGVGFAVERLDLCRGVSVPVRGSRKAVQSCAKQIKAMQPPRSQRGALGVPSAVSKHL